ncbi:uncharacterized protein LOC123449069 [Hordeum vulgare subsp. vulgare]|uniref:DUF962 domain-containing protein n=1 Tax=Hordeum vulgare subsp. vulgare TaxID=112509 RepID=A0A8I6XLK7_HORVV|nr:uncharacterized protein LOC123449069 [Hordeum vulgare subsp. vulgare]
MGGGGGGARGKEFGSMEEFWGFYLGQHSKAATRRWHFAGTLASLVCALLAAATGRAALLAACPVLGYGMAWYSHFFVEGNRPATFGHPVWSLLCDYRMFALILTGRIDAELARLRIHPPRLASD